MEIQQDSEEVCIALKCLLPLLEATLSHIKAGDITK